MVVNPNRYLSDIQLSDKGVVCLDRVALRKSWAHHASYWIDILQDRSDGRLQVFKSWAFKDKDGVARHRHASMDPTAIKQLFFDLVEEKIRDKDYIIAEHQQSQSPVSGAEWSAFLARMQTQYSPMAVSQLPSAPGRRRKAAETPEAPPQRKAKNDWW